MEGYISPVSSGDEEDELEVAAILQEELKFDEVDINIHFHCEHCFRLDRCKVWPKPGWSCEVIYCPHHCGMRFHTCKLSEHELMCSNMRVPCLNAGYGCPHLLLRYLMSDHLPVCPASVVVCAAERNRWVAGTRHRETVAPPPGYLADYSEHDLDVALALQDQRVVNQLAGLSSKQLSAATTATNKRYPLLPLHSPLTGGGQHLFQVRGDATDSRRPLRSPSFATDEDDLTPGLSGSVCAKLRGSGGGGGVAGAAREEGEGRDEEEPPRQQQPAQQKPVVDQYYLENCCHDVHYTMCKFCRHDSTEEQVQLKTVWREEWRRIDAGGGSADGGGGGDCTRGSDSDGDGGDCDSGGGGNWKKEWKPQRRVARVRRRGHLDRIMFVRVDESDDDTTAVTTALLPQFTSHQLPQHMPGLRHGVQPFMAANERVTAGALRIELGCDNYSKHQTKPRSMLTIQCLQVFRRDEFPGHCKHVHCEVMVEGLGGGLLLRRCPLAAHGCPYTIMARTAGSQKGEIIFSTALQAFGLRPHLPFLHPLSPDTRPASVERSQQPSPNLPSPSNPSSTLAPSTLVPHLCGHQFPPPSPSARLLSPSPASGLLTPSPALGSREDSPAPVLYAAAPRLTCLPQELLQHILSFLDGFSLSQAALSCRAVAAACAGLVRERGLILQYWHRVTPSSGPEEANIHWRIGEPWWVFSTSFEGLDRWDEKEDLPSMSDHLKRCPYYQRVTSTEKFCYGRLPSTAGRGALRQTRTPTLRPRN